MHRNGGGPETFLVASQDDLSVDLPRRFGDDGIFEVVDSTGDRAFQGGTADRRHIENREKRFYVISCTRKLHRLTSKVEDGGERRRTREALDFSPVRPRQKLRSGFGKWGRSRRKSMRTLVSIR